MNGPQARLKHSAEINLLLYEVRRCLIEVPHLSPNIKAFLLMTLDLHYNNYRSISIELDQLYGSIVNQYDMANNTNKMLTNKSEQSFSLRSLKDDFSDLRIERQRSSDENESAFNQENSNLPIRANDRLMTLRQKDSNIQQICNNVPQLTVRSVSQASSIDNSPSYETYSNKTDGQDPSSSPISLSTNNESVPMRSPLVPISTSRSESASSRKSESFSPTQERQKLTSFDWFEEVENVENSFNIHSNNSDNLSVKSFGSNSIAASENYNRSAERHRKNNHYRHPHDHERQTINDFKERHRKNSQNRSQADGQLDNWRSGRNSSRNEFRNDHNKRERDYGGHNNSNHVNNRKDFGSREQINNFRRPIMRGGSVDSNIKEFNNIKNHRFGNRNQDNGDNYDNFPSYRKNHTHRTYTNNSKVPQLPPRLQKLQQQQQQKQLQESTQEINSESDNNKRFQNNRNNVRKGFPNNDRERGRSGGNNSGRRENGIDQSTDDH